MIGFDAGAVAIAVRRALGNATSWDDHEFDVIGPVTMAPIMHVALDEVLPHEVAAGRRRPGPRGIGHARRGGPGGGAGGLVAGGVGGGHRA